MIPQLSLFRIIKNHTDSLTGSLMSRRTLQTHTRTKDLPSPGCHPGTEIDQCCTKWHAPFDAFTCGCNYH